MALGASARGFADPRLLVLLLDVMADALVLGTPASGNHVLDGSGPEDPDGLLQRVLPFTVLPIDTPEWQIFEIC